MKRMIWILLCVIMVSTSCISVSAMENVTYQEYLGESIVEPQADSIVVKYRIYERRLQYRRWNNTKNRWVDPYWIDV